ncbi:MarR family winged helix-turn-helix transcriptional regulator [Frondihabitans sp. PAMC 28766]|uniref:MarR family winged helix-turn-helix transcriptional regulator n=1 Tax=Frondihabitans sp. PAMC 28766 TaxID=1795630 RepID=UPI0012FFC651|nr:MarR family winged helix-turn-helix transcriptional regulator [Frondihabitans sp. PAMC 28766]
MPDPAPRGDSPASPFDAVTIDVLLAWQGLELASRHARESFAARANVSLTDFQALVFLSEKNGMAPKEVGAILGITTGAMTALIDRLEGAGYVVRRPHPTDRRSTRLTLTAEGRSAVSGAGALYAEVLERVVPEAEREAVSSLFRRLAQALDAREPAANEEPADSRPEGA